MPGTVTRGKSLAFAQEAVKHQPGNTTFKDTLGEAYFRAGQTREAVPLLLEYTANGSLFVDDWFLLAMTHWNLGEKAKARCWYRIGQEWMAVHEYQTAKQRLARRGSRPAWDPAPVRRGR